MNEEYKKRLLQQRYEGKGVFTSPNHIFSRQAVGDRFIPCRASANWQNTFSLRQENDKAHLQKDSKGANRDDVKGGAMYSLLLKNELLGTSFERVGEYMENAKGVSSPDKKTCNLFKFKVPEQNVEDASSPFSLSPVSSKSQKLLCSPKKTVRNVLKHPYKVLDAPKLRDDFYLNLVDWSSTNVVCVGLDSCAYLWNANTNERTLLCDLQSEGDYISSVVWSENGDMIAVGTSFGYIMIYDTASCNLIALIEAHSNRIGVLAWNGDILISGSRDRTVLQTDVRVPFSMERRLFAHRLEVCGLKWSPDKKYFASGGNDNCLFVWDVNNPKPIQSYSDHVAAVKAIAWSPHQHGLLASGGGTEDMCIRFWDTLTGQLMRSINTGTQVCNLAWSKHSPELVSTHGYSQNQILIWKYPALTHVAELTGHTMRVLYLAMSPDGESVVTGAGDETLRFWSVFSRCQNQKQARSALNLFASIR